MNNSRQDARPIETDQTKRKRKQNIGQNDEHVFRMIIFFLLIIIQSQNHKNDSKTNKNQVDNSHSHSDYRIQLVNESSIIFFRRTIHEETDHSQNEPNRVQAEIAGIGHFVVRKGEPIE